MIVEEECNMDFKKLPPKIRNELIDLSELSEEEAIEKMREIISKNSGELTNTTKHYLDEQWKMPIKVDRKSEAKKIKTALPKKKVPKYVEQFGVNKRSKRW